MTNTQHNLTPTEYQSILQNCITKLHKSSVDPVINDAIQGLSQILLNSAVQIEALMIQTQILNGAMSGLNQQILSLRTDNINLQIKVQQLSQQQEARNEH